MPKQLSRLSVAPRALSFVLMILQVAVSVTGQRAIQNPSVQNPAIANGSNERIAENTLLGWLTTHPTGSCGVGPASCRPIDDGQADLIASVHPRIPCGNAWIELNADVNSMIFQPVCMTNGESFSIHSSQRQEQQQYRRRSPVSNRHPTGMPAGSRPADTYSFR